MYTRVKIAKKILKTKKGRSLDVGARVMYMALAKEADRLNRDSVELTDEEAKKLFVEELMLQTIEEVKITLAHLGKPHDDDECKRAIGYLCEVAGNYDFEKILSASQKVNKMFKKLSKSKEELLNSIWSQYPAQ